MVLQNAATHVTKVRGSQHGDVEPSFRMIAELWSTHINHATAKATGVDIIPPVHLSAWDVLQMMSMLKKARALYGDETLPDHYEDDAGYTALAAMLGGVDAKIDLPDEPPIPQFLRGSDQAAKDMAEQLAEKSRELKEDMDPYFRGNNDPREGADE